MSFFLEFVWCFSKLLKVFNNSTLQHVTYHRKADSGHVLDQPDCNLSNRNSHLKSWSTYIYWKVCLFRDIAFVTEWTQWASYQLRIYRGKPKSRKYRVIAKNLLWKNTLFGKRTKIMLSRKKKVSTLFTSRLLEV